MKKTSSLMTHCVIGHPSLKQCQQAILNMAAAGADFIELQIPFSDPIADGPTIMEASDTALAKGINASASLKFAATITKKIRTPIILMAYYNSVFAYGLDHFCRQARKAGVYGVIVPDMPVDEEVNEHFIATAKRYSIHNILVISPGLSSERLKQVARYQSGIIYCTARAGITGQKSHFDKGLFKELKRIKRYIKVPLALGFGISTPEQIRQVKGYVEIVVVGSAIVNKIEDKSQNLSAYVSSLKQALLQ